MNSAPLAVQSLSSGETSLGSLDVAADALLHSLDQWLAFGASHASEVQAAAEAAADAILAAAWPKRGPLPGELVRLAALGAELVRSGARPAATTALSIERAERCLEQGGPAGISAAMLLVAPWDLPRLPGFGALPDELWAPYAAWLFAPAAGYAASGDARRHAENIGRDLNTLADWAERNLGAPAVRAAAKTWLDEAAEPLGRESEAAAFKARRMARGRLFRRSLGCAQNPPALVPMPRTGRAVRVGFLARVFDDLTRLRTAPLAGGLPSGAFEAFCFQTGQQSEFAVAHAGREVTMLPADPVAQQDQLLAAGLDALVFLDDLAALPDAYSRLGLLRLAPLQIATTATEGTTGLPQMDLYLSGEKSLCPGDAPSFTERLALLPGSADFLGDEPGPAGTEWTRDSLGLPPEAVVLFSAASREFITPEVLGAWAKILSEVPSARLVLVPFHPRHPGEVAAREFQARLDAVIDAAGVGSDRVALLDSPLPGASDLAALAKVADLALDVPGDGLTADAACLAQVPLVAISASAALRRGAAGRLADLNMDELAACDFDEFVRLVAALAGDSARLSGLRERFAQALDERPYFQDALAIGADFGALVNEALDELELHGARRFARRAPLRVAAPFDRSPEALRRRGEAALGQGDAALAHACFLGAIQRSPHDAELWLLLARACDAEGATDRAVESLEASLRLDHTNVDAWLLFSRLAHRRGVLDLAGEALEEARKLAPSDPRVAALAAEINPLA